MPVFRTAMVVAVLAISAAHAQSTTTYLYDRDGRSAGTLRHSDGATVEYDASGRVTGTLRSQGSTTTQFDGSGRVESTARRSGGTT